MTNRTENSNLRVVLCGGGTGGHLFPALAIAGNLQQRVSAVELLFIGANGKMEMEKVPVAGYKIEGLNIAGLHRKNPLKNISLPFKVIKSVLKAKNLLKEFKPDIVIGVGGYSTGPVLFAASILNIPILIQEQNFYPGLTNRLLAKKAEKICVAFPNMEEFLPKEKLVLTGNPVRNEIINANKASKPNQKPVLLVIGGSLGARTINHAVLKDFQKIKDAGIKLIWQTGKFYYADIVSKLNGGIPNDYVIAPFIDKMVDVYKEADLVISRAGAISISELSVMGKACILVPSPNVAADHQTKNAQKLVHENAAFMISDSNAIENLVEEAIALINDKLRLNQLQQNISLFAKPEATDKIVDEILKLTKTK